MKIRLTTLALLVACVCMQAYAQPQVEITIAERPATDSIVDFGVTFVGSHTRRALTIRNLGNDSAVVLTNESPFVEFSNLPWIPVDDPRYQNFVVDNTFPIIIAPGKTARVDLRYLAFAEPAVPADSVIEARMRIRVARLFEPTGPFAERLFRLRGRRTTQYLITPDPVLRYDSVYVNIGRQQKTFRVRNLQPAKVAIEKQTLDIKTTVIGQPEISVDVKPSIVIGELDSAFWDVGYQPRNLGFDSAVFTLQYRLDSTSGPVTLDTKISGVGVEQRLRIREVISAQSGAGLRWSGDTVDFGTVPNAGDTIRAMIIVENVGNLDPRIVSEQKRLLSGGTSSDTSSFKIEQPLNNGNPFLARGARDTLIVTYAPTAAGESSMRYAITTDILSRKTITLVPGVEVMSFVFLGRQRRARILVEPTSITFDTATFSTLCYPHLVDSLRITNTGDQVLKVSSILARRTFTGLWAYPRALDIEPQQSSTVYLFFSPISHGTFEDTVDIRSNADGQAVVSLPYRAVVILPRDTTVVSVPDTVTGPPGFDNVIVDVRVQRAPMHLLSRCTLAITVNTDLLRFERTSSAGTATEEAAEPKVLSTEGGTIRLAWKSSTPFLDRDVFTRLVFSARLGSSVQSYITISEAKFGSETCSDTLLIRRERGVFEFDSLCGLPYKRWMLQNQAVVAVSPNPIVDRGKLTINMPRREHVRAVCIDAFGREQAVVIDRDLEAGTHVVDLDAQALPPAAYTVVVWSGMRYVTAPFVVGR